VREKDAELAGYFEQAVPLSATRERLELALEKGYLFEGQVDKPAARTLVHEIAKAVLGPEVELIITKGSPLAHPEESIASERGRRKRAKHEEAVAAVKAHPKIRAALDILGGEIKSVFVPEV
jgi:hypothetical protein